MPEDALPGRVRELWEELAGARFPPDGGVRVVVSPGSRLCPPSWVGAVRIGDTVLITAPDEDTARRVPGDFEALRRAGDEVLGPATLGYLPPGGLRGTTSASASPEAVRALLDAVGDKDAAESGLADTDSPVFATHDGHGILAAAGYQLWPTAVAHLCVLTAPEARGRGLATEAAGAAVRHALEAGLLPQWRARVGASRRVAGKLGFREVGEQVSVRLE
ncbi:GNAT family N-acetyltransferase [Streptomyces niveiscabiei]|uniref:GNAT family N-acetyltransferase n=1 Tax=Streptomyces niveiscabiei TaxID=164115 RepID=UPI0029A72D75|nr:GNAT family N-acetyltransferase [Streptomyces niveiscabiei]MDX3383988.1 GNAT family N-acetyltransferase [Streptomyces niveiscabiei]